MYSILASSVAKYIAIACKEGSLQSCSCGEKAKLPQGNNQIYYYTSCSENIKYGLEVAVKFLDIAEIENGQGLRERVRLQNLLAGRTILKELSSKMKPKCRCHGLSGSCNVMTCWQITPNIQTLGSELKKRYNTACQVRFIAGESSGAPQLQSLCNKAIADHDLVFSDPSPDYCVPDSKQSYGTAGRKCRNDVNPNDPENCQNLCCGRGFVEHTEIVNYSCNCKFVYCCKIACDTCSRVDSYYVCR